MSTSSESAEQLMRICLEETNFAIKLIGSAMKHIAVALYAISKDKKVNTGKTNLANMMKTNKELTIYTFEKKDLKTFKNAAKDYGILYSALITRKNKKIDNEVDIMVKTEDAPKMNRLIERFKITNVKKGGIKVEETKELGKEEINEVAEVTDVVDISDDEILNLEVKADDNMVDDIFSSPNKEKEVLNPNGAKTEKNPLSEHSLKNKENSEGVTKVAEKKSVRKELEEIKEQKKLESELKNKEQSRVPSSKTKQKTKAKERKGR